MAQRRLQSIGPRKTVGELLSSKRFVEKMVVAFLWISPVGYDVGHAEPLSTAQPAQPARLSERLLAFCSANARNYHQLLHDVSHAVQRAALDRKWSEVELLLRKEGFPQIQTWDVQGVTTYRYLVTKDGWHGGDRSAHSLFLEFTVDNRRKEDVAVAKPGFVMTANAVLFAEPNRPYSEVLTGGAYPEGSVVFEGLRLPEAAAAGKKYPILKEIEVSYDFIRDMWSETVPQGFGLTLVFGDSASDWKRGERPYFTAASGLDPLQDRQGKPVAQAFTPQDTIGEFQSWGAEEWK